MSIVLRLIEQSKAVTEHLVEYGVEPCEADPKQSANLKRAEESARRLLKMIKEECGK